MPFGIPSIPLGRVGLLSGETDGLAINFTDASQFDLSTWNQKWNQVRTASVDAFSSPHTFYTQSGTSPKILKTSSTGLGWSPHNLQFESQTLSAAGGAGGWEFGGITVTANTTTAPDGTSTAETFTANAGNTSHVTYTENPVTVVAGAIYCASVYVKKNNYRYCSVALISNGESTSWMRGTIDLDNPGSLSQTQTGAAGTIVNSGVTSVGSGWYRIFVAGIIGTQTDADIQLHIEEDDTPATAGYAEQSWNAAGTEAVYMWGAQLNRGIVPTAYVATTSAAKIGLPISYGEGLLVEPAATNLILQSADFGTTWTNSNGSETTNATTAPDGSSTADKILDSGATSEHFIRQTLTISNATVYTASCYLKKAELDRGALNVYDGTNDFGAAWNLNTGTFIGYRSGGGSETANAITSVGNGWYRCSFTFTSTGTAGDFQVKLQNSDSNPAAEAYTGSTTGIYAWGAQLETGAVATSYIPTVAGTVTRAIDLVRVAVGGFPYSNTVGTLYQSARRLVTNTEHTCGFIKIGDAQDYIMLDWFSDAKVYAILTNAHAPQAGGLDGSAATYTVNTAFQATFAWASNDLACSYNGGAVGTDAAATIPATITHLSFIDAIDSVGFNGFISKVVYVPRRVSDGTLPTWRYA